MGSDASSLPAQFGVFLETVPDAAVVADRQGRMVLVNAQAAALFGFEPAELVGKPVEMLIPPRFRGPHAGHREGYFLDPRTRAMGAAGQLELHGLRKDGSEFPAEISLSPLRTAAGTFAMTAIRDVTERKRVEQERARLHAEVEGARDLLRRELDTQSRDLEALARDLAARKRDLEAALDTARASRDEANRANRVKSDFLALVSHELRTPLSALLLQVDRLAQDPLPSARARTALPRLTAASQRLTALVEALLAHSRVASGRVEPRREPVDLGRMVEEVVWELRPLAEHKGLALRSRTPGVLAPVETDPALVRVVLANLVGNAVKFTLSGEVAVTVAGGAGDQAISVSDTGPGIPDAERDRIFEPFEHLDPIRAKHLPGVGLGLALVREICSALGARVELRSEVGAGSTFTVRFPVAPVERSGVPGRREG